MPRHAKPLTKSKLDRLRANARKDKKFTKYLADAGQPGLYAQARQGGVRFVFEYRAPAGGRRRRMNIDRYGGIPLKKARDIAQKLRGLVAEGVDPQAARKEQARQARTVADVVSAYLKARKATMSPSGYESARRRLEKNVLPKLGDVRAESLTADQVRRLHRGKQSTPVEANRTLTALSAAMNYGGIDPNPCDGVKPFPENGERRALTSDELVRLGEALQEAAGKLHPSAVLAIQLFALTGFRRSELLGHEAKARRRKNGGLRWGDVDLDAGLVNLRRSKTGPQTRVIGRDVVELLAEQKPAGVQADGPVCPGVVSGRPFVGIDRPRIKLYRAAEIDDADLHCLRHTFASIGAHVQDGRYSGLVGPLIGHGYTKGRSITERYIHSDPEAMRPAADAIAGEIARLLGLRPPAQVVGIRSA